MTQPRLRPRGARARKRGVALVMVLGAITILTVILTEFQEETSADVAAAVAERDALKAEYAARSAVALSRLLLAMEPNFRGALTPMFMLMGQKRAPQLPVWEFADVLLAPFNDPSQMAEFATTAGVDPAGGKNLGMAGASFQIRVVDEDSKVNVNLAARGTTIAQDRLGLQLMGLMLPQQYDAMFDSPDDDGQRNTRADICRAIVDWADGDENGYPCEPLATSPVNGGAEDGFYQGAGRKYVRKNAPYDSLEELRMVRGVDDTFWANFVEPDANDPASRVLTVWGQGKINVNNASGQTLLALICGAEPLAELCVDPAQTGSFLMAVGMLRGIAKGIPLFSSGKDFVATVEGKKGMLVPILQQLQLKPVVFKSRRAILDTVTTESKMFSIVAEGIIPGRKRDTRVRITAVVDMRAAEPLDETSPLLGTADPAAASAPDATDLLAALSKNPAGNVVYYRVE